MRGSKDILANKPYIVTFPGVRGTSGQFVVMAEDKKSAIEIAWKFADSQFQITHQKQAAQVKEFKRGAIRVLY
jgi:hypothetical protein